MTLLSYKKPTTPSQRHVCLLDKKKLNKTIILKNKTSFLKNNAGRNHKGQITVYRKGGGHKKKYRSISYERTNISGIVESIEYDPYRSANIARIFCENTNSHSYILAPQGLEKGHFVNSQLGKNELDFKIGNLFYLQDLPLGVFIHNVEFPHSKGGVARSAGCGVQIISKNEKYCRLRLNSGEHRLFSLNTKATLGSLSNSAYKHISLGKAGRSRWLNKRPSVRGVAMNPVDHPHGGGEGKTSGGRVSVTPWGKITKGQPTKKKFNKLIIKKRT